MGAAASASPTRETHFVTFRLADSMPEARRKIQDRWYAARLSDRSDPAEWAAAVRRIPIRERRRHERYMAQCLFRETDQATGCFLLRQPAARRVLEDAVRHFDAVRWQLGDFVVMPNHVAALLLPLPGFDLEALLGLIKKWTARRVEHTATRRGRRWQSESHDRSVRHRAELDRVRRYIQANPVRPGLTPAWPSIG